MDPESKNDTGTCPRPEPREPEPEPPGAAEKEKRRRRGKARSRSKGKTPSRVPSQSRVEAREEFVDVQDIERDIVAGADAEPYDVERG